MHTIKMRNNSEYCVDNQWVAPYNPFFSLKYGAHINVQVVNSVEAIKYLYKYVNKGHDKVTFTIQDDTGNERILHACRPTCIPGHVEIYIGRENQRNKQETTMSMQTMHEVLLKLQERIEFDGLDMHNNFELPRQEPQHSPFSTTFIPA